LPLAGLNNVTIEPLALSDSIGMVDFVFPPGPNSGLGHIDYGDNTRPGRTFPVATTTLDAYLGNRNPRFLMMDVEGAEPMVLRGGQAWIERQHPAIVVEAHHNKPVIHEFLVGHGYTVFSIERFGLRKPQPTPAVQQYNWLAIHGSEAALAEQVDRHIKVCALLPPIPTVHPLSRPWQPGGLPYA
jgi:hypothetical protein